MIDGPLKGVSGTLTEIRPGRRVVIAVKLPLQSLLVEIDHDWLVPRAQMHRAGSNVTPTGFNIA
jgi:hypothetical protein